MAEMDAVTVSRHSFPLSTMALPKAHQVDVWLADLSAMPMINPLGEAGRVLAGAQKGALQRDLRIRGQFFVRLLLGRYLDIPGKDVLIVKDLLGKPSVEGQAMHFNLSHSQSWLCVAVSTTGPVGVDIELNRRISRAKALARRCFSTEEANALEELEEPLASSVFLTRWTKTEALVKAQGDSLARSLKEIRFSYPKQQLMACPKGWAAPAQWSISDLPFDAPIVGALASPESVMAVEIKQLVFVSQ